MGCGTKLKNFFIRLLVYFIVMLWPYVKLQNLFQNVEDFKKSIFNNLAFLNIKIDPKENNDTILIIFFFYTCAECIFSTMGLFNVYIGHVFSMVFFFITNFIYFNPFMEENKIKLINTKAELFFNIGVFFSLGVLAFYPNENKTSEKEKPIEAPKNLEDDDMKKSMPVKKNKRAKQN